MKSISRIGAGMAAFAGAACLGGALFFCPAANAQRNAQSAAEIQAIAAAEGRNHSLYNATKEVSLEGTVASFDENSQQFPAGAHLVVQTSAGPRDVHLGDARVLKKNNFLLTAGASVRVIGASVTTPKGTFFLARLIQQGTKVVAVRTPQGFQVAANATSVASKSKANAEEGAR